MQILLWGSSVVFWVLLAAIALDAKFNLMLARLLAKRYYMKTGLRFFRVKLNNSSVILAEDLMKELHKLSSSSVQKLCREVSAE